MLAPIQDTMPNPVVKEKQVTEDSDRFSLVFRLDGCMLQGGSEFVLDIQEVVVLF